MLKNTLNRPCKCGSGEKNRRCCGRPRGGWSPKTNPRVTNEKPGLREITKKVGNLFCIFIKEGRRKRLVYIVDYKDAIGKRAKMKGTLKMMRPQVRTVQIQREHEDRYRRCDCGSGKKFKFCCQGAA